MSVYNKCGIEIGLDNVGNNYGSRTKFFKNKSCKIRIIPMEGFFHVMSFTFSEISM